METLIQIKCPQCQKKVAWSADNLYRPFCSQRCKTIDLGAWASEVYKLQAKEEQPSRDCSDS